MSEQPLYFQLLYAIHVVREKAEAGPWNLSAEANVGGFSVG